MSDDQTVALTTDTDDNDTESAMPIGDAPPKVEGMRRLAAAAAAAVLVLVLIVAAVSSGGGGDEGGAGPGQAVPSSLPTTSDSGSGAATETVHYFGDPQIGMGKLGPEMDKKRFEAAARESDGVAAVVVAGDIVNQWNNQQYIDLATEVLALFDAPQGVHLTNGVHIVPGNHDVDSLAATAAEFREQLEHYRSTFGRGVDYHSFTTEHATFVMVNSESLIAAEARPENSGAVRPGLDVQAVSEEQWAWLETTLAEAAAGPKPHILPVMHHPPFLHTPDEPAEYFNWPPRARARLIALFQTHGVEHVLCGHTHDTTDVRGAGLHVYTVGGTARTIDERGCGYSVVTITASSVTVAYQQLNSDDPNAGIAPCCNYDLTAEVGGQCPRCTMSPLPASGFDSCTEFAPPPPSSAGSGR